MLHTKVQEQRQGRTKPSRRVGYTLAKLGRQRLRLEEACVDRAWVRSWQWVVIPNYHKINFTKSQNWWRISIWWSADLRMVMHQYQYTVNVPTRQKTVNTIVSCKSSVLAHFLLREGRGIEVALYLGTSVQHSKKLSSWTVPIHSQISMMQSTATGTAAVELGPYKCNAYELLMCCGT